MREKRAAAANGETARRVGPGRDRMSGQRAEGVQALVLRGRESDGMMGAHAGSTSRGEAGDGARREWKQSMLGVWTGRK